MSHNILQCIHMPTLEENQVAAEFLYPDFEGLYTDEMRREVNVLAHKLMIERLKKDNKVH